MIQNSHSIFVNRIPRSLSMSGTDARVFIVLFCCFLVGLFVPCWLNLQVWNMQTLRLSAHTPSVSMLLPTQLCIQTLPTHSAQAHGKHAPNPPCFSFISFNPMEQTWQASRETLHFCIYELLKSVQVQIKVWERGHCGKSCTRLRCS